MSLQYTGMVGTHAFWIVRCQAAQTLAIADSLREIGFEAWTPIAEREYRKSRSKKYTRVKTPILDTFIFVAVGENPLRCAERLDDLRYTLGIRVMRENGRYAGTSEESLAPLRAIEHDAATFGFDNLIKDDGYAIGQRGSVNALAFMGLACTLVGRSRGNLIVLPDGSSLPVTIKAALFFPEKITH